MYNVEKGGIFLELNEYKCPCCGGAIVFDSNEQKMKCPYCDTEFEVDTLRSFDEILKNQPDEDMSWEKNPGSEWDDNSSAAVYSCKSCGGEIICEETTAATSCPYCGNPVIMMGKLQGILKPDYIIPFKLDKKAAKEGLKNHLRKKKFLPKVFCDENHIDEIRGMYVPVWLFDTDADAGIRYRATRVRSWSDSKYIYTETSHYAVFRAGKIGFEHIPVDGSLKMPDELMESIEPFDFSEAVDFGTAYLSGYLADKYDVGADDSIERANERVKRTTEDTFASTVIGYATVTPEQTGIKLSGGNAKYALYPVWMLNTTWNNEKYTFLMNGQTGKFVGDLPCDKKSYWKFRGIVSAIIAAVCFAAGYLIWYLG